MLRVLAYALVCLLVTHTLIADEKKPEGKPEAAKKVLKEGVKKDAPEGSKKVVKDVKKDAHVGQNKVVKEGVKKEAFDKKPDDAAVAKKKQIKAQSVKTEFGAVQKGKLTNLTVDGKVLKFAVEGKEYEFPLSDNSFAVLKTTEREGKSVVLGLQVSNFSEGVKNDAKGKDARQEA